MSNELPAIDTIFHEASELASAQKRAAYLDRACAGDADLRRRVDKLLAAHFEAGSFLGSPASELAVTAELPTSSAVPGTVIGPYKLLKLIGEGGMGAVYMAEQAHPVQCKVALKLIKAGMDIVPGSGSSYPSQLVRVNDVIFFDVWDASSDSWASKSELWKSDG